MKGAEVSVALHNSGQGGGDKELSVCLLFVSIHSNYNICDICLALVYLKLQSNENIKYCIVIASCCKHSSRRKHDKATGSWKISGRL